MKRVNIAKPDFVSEAEDPEGFRSGMARFGPGLGAKRTEEEWLLVLEGRPTLRDPDGEHPLEPWDLVFFTIGPEGAHRIQNDTDESVRVLMYSDLKYPAATVYPDSDKIAVWTGNKEDDGMFRREGKVEYFDRET